MSASTPQERLRVALDLADLGEQMRANDERRRCDVHLAHDLERVDARWGQ